MSRRKSLLILILSIAFLYLPLVVIGQDKSPSNPELINVIVWSDGSWIYVESVEERYGSIIYQKPGGRPIAAREHGLDKQTTLDLNNALKTFSNACASKPVDTSALFTLTGRTEKLFFSIAAQHSKTCLQRLIVDHQQGLYPDEGGEPRKPGSNLSDVAGELALKKSDESSSVVISEQSLTPHTNSEDASTRRLADMVHQAAGTHQKKIDTIDDALKAECAEQKPNDYQAQTWCVNGALAIAQRSADTEGIPAEVFEEIRSRCLKNWPRDFNMQDYCEQNQIRSFKELEETR